MNQCFQNPNLLDIICMYLNIKEILYLSMCNWNLKKILDPNDKNDDKNDSKDNKNSENFANSNTNQNTDQNSDSNSSQYVNVLFYFTIQNEFFDFDKSIFKSKKNLLGKIHNFRVKWKKYLIKLLINFSIYKEENIRKKIKDFFRIHIYLPDVRKECFILDYPNSSLLQMKSCDITINRIHTYNYYSKYIKPELILNPDEKGEIIVLREKLIFEDSLINFKNLFYDFIINEEYKEFVNNVCKYNYDYLTKLYDDIKTENNIFKANEQNNKIIRFIIWVCYSFIIYSEINFEFVNEIFEISNTREIIYEYMNKKNDLINCGLLINSAFENINLIINLLFLYKDIYEDYSKKYLLNQKSSENPNINFNIAKNDLEVYKYKIIFNKKFSLYNLFAKIIDNFYTTKLSEITNKFPILVKDYFKEIFPNEIINPKNERKTEKNEIKIENEINNNEITQEKKEPKTILEKSSNKHLVENFLNCQIDDYINEENANGIMHTQFKIDEKYITDYEDKLINGFETQIQEAINNKMPLDKCFEIVEKITNCEGNSKNLFPNKESLSVIRRTKIRLMKKGYKTLFNQLIKKILEDFNEHIKIDPKDNQKYIYLSATEKLNQKEYFIDFNVLTQTGEENVNEKVNSECEKAKEYIIKNCNLIDSEKYLANDYINCTKIDYVFLLRKLLLNYYKQLEIYKERNVKIEKYLIKKKNKYVEEKGCYVKAENEPNDFLFN